MVVICKFGPVGEQTEQNNFGFVGIELQVTGGTHCTTLTMQLDRRD
jgi:hypothetical protein